MKKATAKEKALWNEAVKATLTEMRRWDGIIDSEDDKKYLTEEITKKVAYKIKNKQK